MTVEKSLAEIEVGTEAEVLELVGGHGFQSRLRALGIVEGTILRMLSRVGMGGPVIVLANRAQVAIGKGMARRVLVRSKVG